jgi:undecaprenyl diphosphate synthase
MNTPRLDTTLPQGTAPAHVAIIMDGNGRWAQARALPRPAGHQAGMQAVREAVEGALGAGVRVLTLFAFSQENWQRPPDEIDALMALLEEYIARERRELVAKGVAVRFLGDLDRLVPSARVAVDDTIRATAGGTELALNICISYGSRAELARAARLIAEDVAAGRLVPAEVDEATVARHLYTAPWPDPDLLIRTSGELRLSNFLLWQLAYAELYVTPVLWPDFTRRDFHEAVVEYQRRDRRFGRVSL